MYKLLFIIISLFVIIFSVTKCNEGFENTIGKNVTISAIPITTDNIADYIYKIYKADVKAIQNLADIAQKLQAGGVTVPGKMIIQNGLDVTNDTKLNNKLGVTGATTLSSTLGVTGATTLSSTLGVAGATTLSSTLGVTGAATLNGKLEVNNDTKLNGKLEVNNDTKLNGKLEVKSLNINGRDISELLLYKIYNVKWKANTTLNQSYVEGNFIQIDRFNSKYTQSKLEIVDIDKSDTKREQGFILKKGTYNYKINYIINNSNDTPSWTIEQKKILDNSSLVKTVLGKAPRWGGNANPGRLYTTDQNAWNQNQDDLVPTEGIINVIDDARVFCYPSNNYYAANTNTSFTFEWLWPL
jgi:hypothetical protein